jgi:hypothetical protein
MVTIVVIGSVPTSMTGTMIAMLTISTSPPTGATGVPGRSGITTPENARNYTGMVGIIVIAFI